MYRDTEMLVALELVIMNNEETKDKLREYIKEVLVGLLKTGLILSKYNDNGEGSDIRLAMEAMARISQKHHLGLTRQEQEK